MHLVLGRYGYVTCCTEFWTPPAAVGSVERPQNNERTCGVAWIAPFDSRQHAHSRCPSNALRRKLRDTKVSQSPLATRRTDQWGDDSAGLVAFSSGNVGI